MTWQGDVVALVGAFRSGEHSPVGEAEATLAAIEASDLNAFSFVDVEGVLERAATVDISLPLGGVPVGVKELHQVAGWPDTAASLLFAERYADHDLTMVSRLRAAGANLIGLTTASEFGGLNCSTTKLNGITRNPWDRAATPGGSSGGSAAAVAGGLVPIATGGDGGGSIRIPAGFCGLVGMKGTAGRIPRGPHTTIGPMTVVSGCLARSVRDAARWYDVCAGFDARDPYSLPAQPEWEAGLGSTDLTGLRVAISPDLGSAVLADAVRSRVHEAGHALVEATGMQLVDVDVSMPSITWEWAIANQVGLVREVGDLWPGCEEQMTKSMAFGVRMGLERFNIEVAGRVEAGRTEANRCMADLFDRVDVVICASNPDVAFPAEIESNTRVAGEKAPPGNNGALTIPANISGNPAVSVPAGLVDGRPIGIQLMGRQHEDRMIMDLARAWELLEPWPLVAP